MNSNHSASQTVPQHKSKCRLALAGIALLLLCGRAANAQHQTRLNVKAQIDYCASQALKTLRQLPPPPDNLPRSIEHGDTTWHVVNNHDWCSGFWPGTLWYLYQGTGNQQWLDAAKRYSAELLPVVDRPIADHDLGFMLYCSLGNGLKLTGNPAYKSTLLRAADSLASLYNPKVGTILSWPAMRSQMNWPHNTIIDNMINLELLFWAAKNGGSAKLYDIAVKHAQTTMHNHFRADYSAYHVVVYDTITGKKIKGVTHQGYADESMWARGQAWAIYGFTLCYRETHQPEFLQFARHVADVFLERLPADHIPYWDFKDPAIPSAPKDASAAAVASSALIELSGLIKDKASARHYRQAALSMLTELSSPRYQSRQQNNAFLLHSTGHKPAGKEIDASIIYADYYYLEALLRLQKTQ